MAVDGREILPWDARLSFKKNCRISQWPIHSTNSWVVNCVVEDLKIVTFLSPASYSYWLVVDLPL